MARRARRGDHRCAGQLRLIFRGAHVKAVCFTVERGATQHDQLPPVSGPLGLDQRGAVTVRFSCAVRVVLAEFADVEGPAVAEVLWRVPDRQRKRLRPWLRNPVVAQGHVVAPDGRRYLVQVVRLSWPKNDSPVGEGIGAFLPNAVSFALGVVRSVLTQRPDVCWGVRVFRQAARHRPDSLVYGAEFREFDDGLERGYEIANFLVAGGKP